MAVDRRALWLGGVVIAAIVAVMAVRSNDPPSAPAGSRPRAPAAQNARDAVDTQPVAVNLGALARERGEPEAMGRNPFRFQPKPPPPPPPSAFSPPPGAGAGAGNSSVFTPVMPPRPTGPPPPPPITLKFIGVVGKVQDGKIVQIAVLSDGRNTDSGTEGKIVFGQYQILKIGTESIDLAYADGRGRQTIRLTGQ